MTYPHHDDSGLDVADLVGPYGWGMIHHAAASFPCAPCAAEGSRLMVFAHDVVNARLGKRLHDPDNFAAHVAEAAGFADSATDRQTPKPRRVTMHSAGATVAVDLGDPHDAGVLAEVERQVGALAQHEPAGEPLRLVHHQDDPADEVAERIAVINELLSAEPAARLVKYIRRSGNLQGQLTSFSPAQFLEITGRPANDAIIDKRGRVPWHLALDTVATELGYKSDEALQQAVEQSLKWRYELVRLNQELARLLPVCDARPVVSDAPCQIWEGEFCRQKSLSCNGTEFVAVRHPSEWSVHQLSDDDIWPGPDNRLETYRKAGEATRAIKSLARSVATPSYR